LSKYSPNDEEDSQIGHKSQLHMACFVGATEVVKILLEKGAEIDKLDSNGNNCLDIAISQKQSEVIKLLLSDQNWKNLIMSSKCMGSKKNQYDLNEITGIKRKLDREVENRQLVNLFNAQNWSAFETLLDKCVTADGNKDFSILDEPVQSESNHPLMLIACSGQERLIKHDVVLTLLNLKWRFIPRFVFYFNLIFVVAFLALVTWLAVELGMNRCECQPCEELYSNISVMKDSGNYTAYFLDSFGYNETMSSENSTVENAMQLQLNFECLLSNQTKTDFLVAECQLYDELGVIFDFGKIFKISSISRNYLNMKIIIYFIPN